VPVGATGVDQGCCNLALAHYNTPICDKGGHTGDTAGRQRGEYPRVPQVSVANRVDRDGYRLRLQGPLLVADKLQHALTCGAGRTRR
jgi:hypothetical protein